MPDKPSCGFAIIDELMYVNQKPHPFCIGNRHVAHAADHCHGMLEEESLRAFPCAMRGCGLPYDQHTKGDHVAVVKVTSEVEEKDLRAWLISLTEWCLQRKVDGFVFKNTHMIQDNTEQEEVAKEVS